MVTTSDQSDVLVPRLVRWLQPSPIVTILPSSERGEAGKELWFGNKGQESAGNGRKGWCHLAAGIPASQDAVSAVDSMCTIGRCYSRHSSLSVPERTWEPGGFFFNLFRRAGYYSITVFTPGRLWSLPPNDVDLPYLRRVLGRLRCSRVFWLFCSWKDESGENTFNLTEVEHSLSRLPRPRLMQSV